MPFIQRDNANLHYQVFGRGSHIVFAFHGYGQEGSHIQVLANALQPDCTIYAFDLFFHGKSKLPKSKWPLRKEFLCALIQQLVEEQGITLFSLMAFSMGGKFALTLTEGFPGLIDKVLLVAPDGIKTNFWYSMATYPGWLQGMFKRTVLKPVPFFKFVSLLDKYNVVDKGLLRFANWHMESTPKRLRIYKSWIGFAQLTFDMREIVGLLNEHNIKVYLFLGEYDKVIPQHSLKIFIKALKNCELVLLKTGHTFLLHDVASYLRRHHEVFR